VEHVGSTARYCHHRKPRPLALSYSYHRYRHLGTCASSPLIILLYVAHKYYRRSTSNTRTLNQTYVSHSCSLFKPLPHQIILHSISMPSGMSSTLKKRNRGCLPRLRNEKQSDGDVSPLVKHTIRKPVGRYEYGLTLGLYETPIRNINSFDRHQTCP
jgi:hypothetical protein